MKGNRLIYVGAILAIGLDTLFSIVSPLVLKFTIDSIIGTKPMEAPGWIINVVNNYGGREALGQRLWIFALVLVTIVIVRGIFLYFKGKWSAEASESIAKNMRETLYDHLQHLPYDYHVKAETGDLIQRCTSDVETIRRFLAVQFVEIGRAIFMISFVLFIMLSLNVTMTLIAMAVVPIIFVFAIVFFY